MAIKSVYVLGASKKYVNEMLAQDPDSVSALEFSPWGRDVHLLSAYPDGTVVKIFRNWAGSSPVAHTYSTVKRKNGKLSIK